LSRPGAWWKHAVFYEIYTRSFQDSNDDGIGDLNGIASRLDYLADLGVSAIWLTPFYPSPQVDFGYDVSDYEAVDPQFGTLADFDRLTDAAHRRGIRVIVDVVLNHTSDQHPWFLQSRASRDNPRRDWYVWHDGLREGPPNNWESAFGGPAWTFDPATSQWYYHFFYAEQPDLNWRNPEVEARMLQTFKFWLDHGVDGFRLDAVNTLFEDPSLEDNPLLPAPKITLTGVRTQNFVQTQRLPEVHDVLRRARTFVERHAPDAVLISEAYVDRVEELVCFYGCGDEMHLPFNFFLAQVPALAAGAFRRAVDEIERAVGTRWPSLVLGNHDIARSCDRLGGDPEAVARMLAMLLLTLRGSPFLYYGEEIGMRTEPPASLADVRDPVGRTFWPRYKGRDGVRRPMQWDGSAGGGFSRGKPWLPLASDARARHVAAQTGDPASLLAFYNALLHARATSLALGNGDYRTITSRADVFAYERRHQRDVRLIVLNMAAEARDAGLGNVRDLPNAWRTVIGTHRAPRQPVTLNALQLAPYEALLLDDAVASR
jgi:alpha-glucosidase